MLGLGLGLNINKQLQGFESLVKSAGGVSYYDARKDLITANGITPDRSDKGNNVTWNNFAGTGLSGLVIENGKVFRRLDGADDFGSMANSPSLDITTNELALCSTFGIPSVGLDGYLIARSLDSSTTHQYAIEIDASGAFLYLDGVRRASISNLSANTWYNIIFYRNAAGVITPYLNIVAKPTSNYVGALTSRPNTKIGARSNSTDGTLQALYLKCDIATETVYSLPILDINKILKAETALSKGYI
jgi:hypothetical protein